MSLPIRLAVTVLAALCGPAAAQAPPAGAPPAQQGPDASPPLADPAASQPIADAAVGPAASPQAAEAASPPTEAPAVTERQRRRFPQPVRAGDLHGRKLLQPGEAQTILGYVDGVVLAPDGPVLVVALAGWLGLPFPAGRLVAVPADKVALLGEHVALMDLSPEMLDALPSFDPASGQPVTANSTLAIGIVKPFH